MTSRLDLAVEHLFKMAATDAEFWASLETNFPGIACTLEAETSVINLTQYKLFIGDDKKITISGVTFSFKFDSIFLVEYG